tara:strand:- start:1453 stop:1569 length:117 start_codon:yes stop_codon:yes gene_type:complete
VKFVIHFQKTLLKYYIKPVEEVGSVMAGGAEKELERIE